MAGSVIPAVLISGINSDLPGPILARVSQNVVDSAIGKYVLILQGSRLIGAYQNASAYRQQRVQIAWQRQIFPNTSSMNLLRMPGTDQSGYAGFSDQINNHYLATFGTAALMSLISAGQMVGQMTAFGGWNLRTLRLLPTQPMGDVRRDGWLVSLGSVRRPRPADDRKRTQSS